MKQEISSALIAASFLNSHRPVWRSIPSREMAKALGVSLQSLANWRVRNDGPEPEAPKRGKGNRTFYRPDKVLLWLDGGQRELWEYSRDWLLNRGLDVVGGLDQNSTVWMIEGLDDLL